MVIVPINIFDSCNQRKFKLITTETLERYREIKKKINGSQLVESYTEQEDQS